MLSDSMRIKVHEYMLDAVHDHIDPMTDEINMTFLAEDAAMHFNVYDENGETPEDFFELAFDVSEEKEKLQ